MTGGLAGRAARTVTARVVGWLTLMLLASACGGGAPPTPPPAVGAPIAAVGTTAAKAGPVLMPKEPEPEPPLPPISYEAKARRDPFTPITLGKEKSERTGLMVTTLKLAGVIRGRTLLALLEAPDGLGYILKPGDTLGDGRVTEITQNAVTFAVAARSGQAATTTTLRLVQD